MPSMVVTVQLLVKYAAGEATGAEQEAVQRWLSLNAANRQQLDDILLQFQQADKLPVPKPVDERFAWQKVRRRLEVAPVKKMPFVWLQAAAIFILLAGTAWYFLFNRHSATQPPAVAMVNIFSETGSHTDTLPDSSTVTLTGRSALHYTTGFAGANRAVRLEGEAFFSVAHNKAKPFVVSVKDVTVTVTGTSFTIRGLSTKTEVIVHTGLVRVARKGKEITLLPGDVIIVADADTILAKEPVLQASPDTIKKPAPLQTDEGLADDVARQKTIMRSILRDIRQGKLAGNDSIQSFSLDWENFSINNAPQTVGIYIKYKTKYLHLPGYGFYYGPPAVTGKGFFFSKQELEH